MAKISFETAYRQLDGADRAFVDDFVSRIERASEQTGRDMFEILQEVDPSHLPERERQHLSRSIVTAAISERVRDLVEAQNISPRKLIKRGAAIAFASLDHFYDEYNDTFDFARGTPEQRDTVASYEKTENARTGQVTVKIKLKDDVKMLMALMTQQGLLNPDGVAINPDAWIDAGGISTDATGQDAADAYARLMSGQDE